MLDSSRSSHVSLSNPIPGRSVISREIRVLGRICLAGYRNYRDRPNALSVLFYIDVKQRQLGLVV